MDLSFRRIAGRMVLAAGVCATAILILRDERPPRDVTFVVDPRPMGAALLHLDVTISAGDDIVAAWQSGDERPLRPLRIVTPAPAGPVTITLDVLAADGPHRVEHHVAPTAGSTVEIKLGVRE